MSDILSTFVAVGFDLTGIEFSHLDYLNMIMGPIEVEKRASYLMDIYDLSKEDALEDMFYDVRANSKVRLIETEEEGCPKSCSKALIYIMTEVSFNIPLLINTVGQELLGIYADGIKGKLPQSAQHLEWRVFYGSEISQ